MRLPARPWALSAFVLIGCSTGQPPPEQGLRYETVFFPEYYETERIVGVSFAVKFNLNVVILPGEGKTRYEAEGRSAEIAWPPEDPRPRVVLRLTGPKGTIERSFLFASGFGRPMFLPKEDVEALGLPGPAAATRVSLVRGDEGRECWQVPLEVEFPGLGLKRTMPVL